MADINERTNIGESTQCRNEVKIAGRVVNVFQFTNKEITNITVETTAGAKLNHPKITWHGANSKKIAETLKGKNRPYVSITGYVQTSRSNRNGKIEYHQNIVGKTFSIEVIPKSENEVYITGRLDHKYNLIKKSTGERQGTRIRVKIIDEKPNYPEMTLFGEQCEAAQAIEPGGIVSVIGTVQTEKKIELATGRLLHYESIIGVRLDL